VAKIIVNVIILAIIAQAMFTFFGFISCIEKVYHGKMNEVIAI